jgi:hypothetical protein
MKSEVHIPTWLATLFVGSIIALQGWQLRSIADLQVSTATLSAQVTAIQTRLAIAAMIPKPKVSTWSGPTNAVLSKL